MVRSPIAAALREPAQSMKPRSTALIQPMKTSRPVISTQCCHASSLIRQPDPMKASTPLFLIRKQDIPSPLISRRHESTIASTATSSTTTNPPSGPSSEPNLPMTWDHFLRLRAIRRRFNLAASISTSIITTTAGISILSQQDIDKIGNLLFGLDPILAMGISTVSCGAVGWLFGPFAGNAVFGLWYRRLRTQFALREKQFYQRIKKHRADPSTQSVSNPVPDYYGEKISSVHDYRRWLKDQRAFTKKRTSY